MKKINIEFDIKANVSMTVEVNDDYNESEITEDLLIDPQMFFQDYGGNHGYLKVGIENDDIEMNLVKSLVDAEFAEPENLKVVK